MSQIQVNKFLADLRKALGKLESLPFPTIAAIDGPALGGGLELALACDMRVAGHHVTKIGLPETALGIIPGAGGTQRATRLLGPAKAKDLIFTARILDSSEAQDFGQFIITVYWCNTLLSHSGNRFGGLCICTWDKRLRTRSGAC